MKILINERLSEHRCKTPEGYLICTDAILARTGKQTYRKNEIFKDSDDETEIEVDRTEDEVFSPQTLASFENKPVTVEHPDEDVNVHNYKEYAVGFVRDVHRGEVDGQPVILGNLVITDEQTIQEIENGEHTDLSCGYDCDIADEPNPCQRNIRGNHVALCEQGRAGIARIVDSKCKDANHLPAKVKRDLQKFLNHKSTFISNKDYDIAEFVKEFERVSRLWAEFPLKIVRESIKGWFKTGDGMMRKDYVFSIEGYDDRFMVSIYAKPDTYETTELNAYFTDSVKDNMIWTVVAEFEEEGGVEGSKNFIAGLTYLVEADSEQEAINKVKKVKPNARKYKATKSAKTFSETEVKFMKNRGRYIDALHTFEVCYFDNGPVCIMLNANSTEDALRKFRREYGWYTIKYIHQKDSTKDALIPPTKKSIESFYAKPETYETTELNAYFTDSVKDTRMKVANLTNGYAIVPASRWRKFGLNSEVERFTTNLDEARYIRSSLERNDGISFVIVDVTQRRTTDSMKDVKYVIMHPRKNLYLTVGAKTWSDESDPMIKKFDSEKEAEEYAKKNTSDFKIAVFDSVKDALIPPTKEAINKFEVLLRIFDIEIDRKGLTPLGRVHYQVRANMKFDRFVKRLERIDNEMDKLGIPMTFNAGSDGNTCTAGIDLDKQYVKDSQRAQKIQKIIKVVKSIK